VSRYRSIDVEKVNHAVRTLCRVLQVSRAAYDHWSIHPLFAHASADLELSERIAAIHARSRQTYGAPRVHAELRICGERHSRKRIARLMHRAGIAGRIPRRYRRTTIGDPFTVLPDLVQRDFAPSRPDELWVGDITDVRTWEGWLYLSTIIDCFSRRVVGWAMADHLRTELPLTALHMALARRRPRGTLIHDTDRGCQYTSEAYTNVLETHGGRSSRSRPGISWDSAVAESFFSALKLDLLYRHTSRPVPRRRAPSSSTSRVSTIASAATQRSPTSVRQTTNPRTLLCARLSKHVRQTGARPGSHDGRYAEGSPVREVASATSAAYPPMTTARTSALQRTKRSLRIALD
jgi:putative transposase